MHVNRLSNPLESEKNFIQDILNLMENVPLNQQFLIHLRKQRMSTASRTNCNLSNENDLSVFRGCDGYSFNIIQLTKAFHAEEATPRTTIKGNILTVIESTENFVTFQ